MATSQVNLRDVFEAANQNNLYRFKLDLRTANLQNTKLSLEDFKIGDSEFQNVNANRTVDVRTSNSGAQTTVAATSRGLTPTSSITISAGGVHEFGHPEVKAEIELNKIIRGSELRVQIDLKKKEQQIHVDSKESQQKVKLQGAGTVRVDSKTAVHQKSFTALAVFTGTATFQGHQLDIGEIARDLNEERALPKPFKYHVHQRKSALAWDVYGSVDLHLDSEVVVRGN